jgi:hypothetical protein
MYVGRMHIYAHHMPQCESWCKLTHLRQCVRLHFGLMSMYWLLYVNQHKLCQITFWPACVVALAKIHHWWYVIILIATQWLIVVCCFHLSICCWCWLSVYLLPSAAVVHDKIPTESVMKWWSVQVIVFSLPSVVDCCLFYFVACCCMHIVVPTPQITSGRRNPNSYLLSILLFMTKFQLRV